MDRKRNGYVASLSQSLGFDLGCFVLHHIKESREISQVARKLAPGVWAGSTI